MLKLNKKIHTHTHTYIQGYIRKFIHTHTSTLYRKIKIMTILTSTHKPEHNLKNPWTRPTIKNIL